MKKYLIILAIMTMLLVGCAVKDDGGNWYIPKGKCGVCDALGLSCATQPTKGDSK